MSEKLKLFKKVIFPIEVPNTDFCFGGKTESGHHVTCGHFDNDGGEPTCRFNLDYNLKYDKENRVPRPMKCRNLKEL
jgi:hypothetical protein